MSDRKVKRLTPNSIANLVMADEAWHDSLYVKAEDYDSLLADFEALRTALAAEPVKPITVPKTVPLPPIICGFVDVRFDGEGWFCDKCGKRMSADFETSVRRGSGEKCYLELMQRKSEAVRAMSERNMK